MKRRIFSVLMLSGLVSALGAPAVASADGVTFTPLGSIYIPFATPLYPAGPYTLDFQRVDAAPGGSTPWHTHPASVYGLVTGGTLTRAFGNCTTVATGMGGTFVERPGEVHQGRNDGSGPASLYVMFVVPDGQPAFAPADAPDC